MYNALNRLTLLTLMTNLENSIFVLEYQYFQVIFNQNFVANMNYYFFIWETYDTASYAKNNNSTQSYAEEKRRYKKKGKKTAESVTQMLIAVYES